MKFERLTIRQWSGRIPNETRHAQISWGSRRGVQLELHTSCGARGVGEASPLPGYSPDSLSDCVAALRAFDCQRLPSVDGCADLDRAWTAVAAVIPAALPAARCALEMALADLCALDTHQPLWHLLGAYGGRTPPIARQRSIAALLTAATSEALFAEAQARAAEGYRTLKLKSRSQLSVRDERALWSRILETTSDDALKLRVDANQSWGERDIGLRLAAAADVGLELVEEPTSILDPWNGPPSPVPTAIDESLANSIKLPTSYQLAERNIKVIVIKPMLLGLRRSLELAAWARESALEVMVTHLFDGPSGYALASQLAFAVGSTAVAHGLAPHSVLSSLWPDLVLNSPQRGTLSAPVCHGLGQASIDQTVR